MPVLLMRWLPPVTSAHMVKTYLAAKLSSNTSQEIRYKWTPWEKISPVMRLAVVAAEDQKFPDHFGFDLKAMTGAVRDHQAGKRLRGASTITQQVAKNLFLWQGRSYLRKALEAYFSVLLEIFWSKRRILEVYLNIAELGDRTFGVHAAAELHFRKKTIELTRREAALLAASLPNPHMHNAAQPGPYLRERSRWIESQMTQLGSGYLKNL